MIAKILMTMLAGVMGVVSALGLLIFQGGVATVSVENQEVDLFLPVPMVLADVALTFMPRKELEEARREIGPYREVVLAAVDGLQECPDAVLVDVRDRDERVHVTKHGDDLVVDVRSASDGNVHVRVPLRSVRRIVDHLIGEVAAPAT